MSKRKYVKPAVETVKGVTVIENEVKDESSNVSQAVEEKTMEKLDEENQATDQETVTLDTVKGLNPTFIEIDNPVIENTDVVSSGTESTVEETETQETPSEITDTDVIETVIEAKSVSQETLMVEAGVSQEPSVYVINLKDKEPTQGEVVATLKETAINTPVNPEAINPSTRRSAVNESNALIETVCKDAEAGFVIPLQTLQSFVNDMDPLNLVSDTVAANKHVMLYRALVNGIETNEANFNVFFGTILNVINIHNESVFHEKHLLRGFAQANFRGKEANHYVSLLTLFKAVAKPETRSFNIRGFNLTKTLEGLSERAQQKVRTFFNV